MISRAVVSAALLSLSTTAFAQPTTGSPASTPERPSPPAISPSAPTTPSAPVIGGTSGGAGMGTTAPVVPSRCVGMIGEQRERCIEQFATGTGGVGSPSGVGGSSVGGAGIGGTVPGAASAPPASAPGAR